MGNLCLLVEWIYQHQVDSILCHVTCTWSLSSRQECEMRATFDPESLWIEPNILKLVELQEADKLLIRHQVNDEFPFVVSLKCVLQDDFRISQIVANAGKVCLVLVEHIGLSLHNVILVTRVDVPHAFWHLCAEHTRLVPFRDMNCLEYVFNNVRGLVPSKLKPNVILAHKVADRDLCNHHFAF